MFDYLTTKGKCMAKGNSRELGLNDATAVMHTSSLHSLLTSAENKLSKWHQILQIPHKHFRN